MKKLTESDLLARVARLEKILALNEAPFMGGQPGYDEAGNKIGANGTTPAAPAPAPAPQAGKAAPAKVAYEKDFPAATAMEIQKKLNAAGEKLAVDGKMGPATRAAMARHPEITSQPQQSQDISADYRSANNTTPAATDAASLKAAQDAAAGNTQSAATATSDATPAGDKIINPVNPNTTAAGSEFGTDATFAAANAGQNPPAATNGLAGGKAVGAAQASNSNGLGGAGNKGSLGAGDALTRGLSNSNSGQAGQAGSWTPSAEQAKFLGGANQQDPYILNRMPGQKPPITHFKDPKDQALAKRLGFPATAAQPAAPQPAGSGTANNTTMTQPQPPAQSAMYAQRTNPTDWSTQTTASSETTTGGNATTVKGAPELVGKTNESSQLLTPEDSIARIVSLVNYRR